MKFLAFLLFSALLHLAAWLAKPTESMVSVSGVKAQVLDRKVKVMQLSLTPPVAEPLVKTVKQNQHKTEFNGKTLRIAKAAKATSKPDKISLNEAKAIVKAPETPPKEQVKPNVNKPKEVAPKKPSPAKQLQTEQLASAKHKSQQDNQVDEFVELDKPALFKSPRPELIYPLKAKRRGHQGVSLLAIELDKQGNIVKLSVVKSSGYKSLDQAAINNVKQWQFHPFKQGQQAVRARFTVPIEFKLS
ncbi:energy transducer TonB [Pseudoalteromonas sp. SSM20]|uniref:energy transducer TonB n=1 Tax=Pseudoalteromonas sp. SSM20 TaxID=3139394 RepID=UPI003BAB18A5